METSIRGRPQRPAREPSDDSSAGRLRSRIAWMLRVNRLYGTNPAWVSGAEFAATFQGGCHPHEVSESKISRWETGIVHVPHHAVRRYEQLLCLPASSLSSTIDVLSRYMSPLVAPRLSIGQWPRGLPVVTGRSLEDFFEQVSSPSTMTAAEWDDMTRILALTPGLRLRRKEWDSISSRLLIETVAADGAAWKPRHEAFNRLLEHPDGQLSAVQACADWANCRENRVFTETVGILDACRHPAASAAVLNQLTAPTNNDAFAGALLACIRMISERDFSLRQLQIIADVALNVLSGSPDSDDQLSAHAAAVLTRLPEDTRPHVSRQMHRFMKPSASGSRQPCTSPDTSGSSFSDLITARSISRLPREISRFDDQVLPTLIDELLHAPVSETRMQSAMLIWATPYRDPVANTLAWAISGPRRAQNSRLIVHFLEALRILGGTAERELVERIAADCRAPFSVQDAAFRTLGHMGGTSDNAFWQKIITQQGAPTLGQGVASERLLNHAVYSLSIKRHIDGLRRIAADHTLTASARDSARWWLNLPSYMFASAEK